MYTSARMNDASAKEIGIPGGQSRPVFVRVSRSLVGSMPVRSTRKSTRLDVAVDALSEAAYDMG